MNKKILITGVAGMLGSQARLDAPPDVEVIGTDLRAGKGVDAPNIDLSHVGDVRNLFASYDLRGVIHTAAFTAVDAAEERVAEAFAANVTGSRIVSAECARKDIPLVAVSTDFVFDGTLGRPYSESAVPNPLSVYGRSKLQGERVALNEHPRGTMIARTQWLYGPRGNHFLATMHRLSHERDVLRVVNDQIGSPTSTLELAPALWDLLSRGSSGIWHASCEGSCTWYELTVAMLEKCGIRDVKVVPITTAEYTTRARRPAYSTLNCSRLATLRGKTLRPWRDALSDFLAAHPL